MLLILGSSNDHHVTSVTQILDDKGCKYKIFGEDDNKISVSYNKGIIENTDLEMTKVVWNRIKTPIPIYKSNSFQEEYVIKSGWMSAYKFILSWAQFNGIPIFNSRFSKYSKIQDLCIAHDSGFITPPSIIPYSKENLLEFFDSNEETLILKPMNFATIPNPGGEIETEVMLARRVTMEDVLATESTQITTPPQFFQKEIRKKIELRVIATQEKIFTFIINSQKYESTSVDWRKGSTFLDFDLSTQYDAYLHPKLKLFLEKCDLLYGIFDFIVTPDNDIYFLECNDEGQWHWLILEKDHEIPLAIANAIYKKFYND